MRMTSGGGLKLLASIGSLATCSPPEARAELGNTNSVSSGADKPADHHGRDRFLDFGSRAGRNRHGHEAQRRHQRGHDHRPQAGQRAFADRIVLGPAFRHELLDEDEHH